MEQREGLDTGQLREHSKVTNQMLQMARLVNSHGFSMAE